MNKRGQLYIFAAIILAVALFLLIGKRVLVFQEPLVDDFELLSNNYDYESAKFINGLLETSLTSEDIENGFIEFTSDFTSYSKNQNPDFMLIYAFKYKDPENPAIEKLFIGNYLNIPILIKRNGVYESMNGCFEDISACINMGFGQQCMGGGVDKSILLECKKTYDSDYPIELIIAGIRYTFNVVTGAPEVVIVSRETIKEQRKVFMNHEFVSGQKLASNVAEFRDDLGIGPNENIVDERNICELLHGKDEISCKADSECSWNVQERVCGQ